MPQPQLFCPGLIALGFALATLAGCQSAGTARPAASAGPAFETTASAESGAEAAVVAAEAPVPDRPVSPWDDDSDTNNWLSRLLFAGGADKSARELANDAVYPFDADRRRTAVANLIDHSYGDTSNAVRMYRLLLGAAGNPPAPQFPADEDPTVRAISAKALGIHGDPRDVDLLAPLLKDESDMVRLEVATALQKLHNPEAIGPLVTVLIGDATKRDAIASTADEDPDVRAAAATALGQYRQPRAFSALITGLFDRDYAVVAASHQALITLSGQDQLSTSPDDWLAYVNSNGSELFADGRAYTFEPSPNAPSFWRRIIFFWSKPKPPAPQPPKGINQSGLNQSVEG